MYVCVCLVFADVVSLAKFKCLLKNNSSIL